MMNYESIESWVRRIRQWFRTLSRLTNESMLNKLENSTEKSSLHVKMSKQTELISEIFDDRKWKK